MNDFSKIMYSTHGKRRQKCSDNMRRTQGEETWEPKFLNLLWPIVKECGVFLLWWCYESTDKSIHLNCILNKFSSELSTGNIESKLKYFFKKIFNHSERKNTYSL